MQKKSRRIARAVAGLVLIDIQERLFPAIFEKERVVQNTVRLIQGAAILGIPTLVTEQYPKGLGATVPDVARAFPEFAPIEKVNFSCCGAPRFLEELQSRGLKDLVLCGIEAHVCVCQTCLDLLDHGLRPFVVADAISSRTPENHRWGVERMRGAGATLVSTEMVLFELLERAATDEFRQILSLVR